MDPADAKPKLGFTYPRKFGVEIELNATDGRDFKKFPLKKKELPEGVELVADLIRSTLGCSVEIKGWHPTHHNVAWIIKPDSSCGMEVCSEPDRGWRGLKKILKVLDAIKANGKITADERCSLHVHLDVSDIHNDEYQLGNVLGNYIKCESVFLDSVPSSRKVNRYCQCIGMQECIPHNFNVGFVDELRRLLGHQKYYSLNTYHMCQGNRATIEFRIIGNEGCNDSVLAKNWIRLLIHFVEMARQRPLLPFCPGKPETGLLWFDPEDVMELLGFTGRYELSPGLEQTRNWFLARLKRNAVNKTGSSVLFSPKMRHIAIEKTDQAILRCGLDPKNMEQYLCPSDWENSVYSDELKV